jgi:hypothetical protein
MAKSVRTKRGKRISIVNPRRASALNLLDSLPSTSMSARRSLAPLLSAWPEAYQPVNDSRWLVRTAFVADSAEKAAKHLLGHIAGLRGEALRSWKQAYRRVFDIGVQAGGPGRAFEEVHLSADTLRRIASVGAHIQVTVYPAEPK